MIPLAADNGCQFAGIYLQGWGEFPPYDLGAPDQAAQLRRLCAEHGVSIAVAEPFLLLPDTSLDSLMPNLRLCAELGVRAINTLCYDPQAQRRIDLLGALAERAAQHGLDAMVELFSLSAIRTVEDAARLIEAIGNPRLRINLDLLHLMRAGGSPADVATRAALIGHVQVSDGPLRIAEVQRMLEASQERGLPGEGEFPLRELIAAVPHDVPIATEIPSLKRRHQGVTPAQWAATAVSAVRALL